VLPRPAAVGHVMGIRRPAGWRRARAVDGG
jgi:hypothetical protein